MPSFFTLGKDKKSDRPPTPPPKLLSGSTPAPDNPLLHDVRYPRAVVGRTDVTVVWATGLRPFSQHLSFTKCVSRRPACTLMLILTEGWPATMTSFSRSSASRHGRMGYLPCLLQGCLCSFSLCWDIPIVVAPRQRCTRGWSQTVCSRCASAS
jgi:hypothetical protein